MTSYTRTGRTRSAWRRRQAGVVVAALLLAQPIGLARAQEPATQPAPPSAAEPPEIAALREAVAAATTDAPPATLRITNRDIVTFRATLALRPPAVRQAAAARQIEELIEQARPGQVATRPLAGGQLISVGTTGVFALAPADLDPAGTDTIAELADATVTRLQLAIDEAIELRTPRRLVASAVLVLLVTGAWLVALRYLARLHVKLVLQARMLADRQLPHLPKAELVRAARVPELAQSMVTALSAGVALLLLYAWLTFVLRQFPFSRPWGEALRGFLISRILQVARGILEAMPDLFMVVLIALITRFFVNLLSLAFRAVEQGRVTLSWLYPETAQPTRRLTTVLLWLFALALAYPYLPGAETDAFKGVSVFVGLIISLGSSGIMNQMMSGLTLTYSRAVRVGDFVRIGDVEGVVTHLGTLSTKIKTPKREEVTIPNAVVVSNQTINYSRFAESEGVFATTTVAIGYDAPWRQVEALLLMAAARTDGIRERPEPAVRQTALRDFQVDYTLFVSLRDPAQKLPTFNRLHRHIQDAFNEHGVQIMTPNYESDPADRKVVPRDRWFVPPARPDDAG
jgi:small-conductance mechanosensitive channel